MSIIGKVTFTKCFLNQSAFYNFFFLKLLQQNVASMVANQMYYLSSTLWVVNPGNKSAKYYTEAFLHAQHLRGHFHKIHLKLLFHSLQILFYQYFNHNKLSIKSIIYFYPPVGTSNIIPTKQGIYRSIAGWLLFTIFATIIAIKM